MGGGPAGAITALLLARAGRRVTIVEKARFPRPKACGDCLSAAATDLLRELGLLEPVLAAGAATIHGWSVTAPSGLACGADFHDASALALERKFLDAALLEAALDAGVELLQGTVTSVRTGADGPAAVVVRTPPGPATLRAPLVVGADGLRSVVARQVGAIRRRPRRRKVSLTTHGALHPDVAADLQTAMPRGEMHVLDGGCIGLAPAGRGRFNLTLVVDAPHASLLRELGPPAFLERWLDRAPSARARLAELGDRADRADLTDVADLPGVADLPDVARVGRRDRPARPGRLEEPFLASGPFDWPVSSPIAPGVALVGDAAGYFDPFTGQGVFQAMKGARLLADALEGVRLHHDAELERGLRRYARAIHRLKGPARRVQWLVDVALARPGRADRVIRRLRAAPDAMNRLLEVTGDLRPPIGLLSPAVLASLCRPSSRRLHDPH